MSKDKDAVERAVNKLIGMDTGGPFMCGDDVLKCSEIIRILNDALKEIVNEYGICDHQVTAHVAIDKTNRIAEELLND